MQLGMIGLGTMGAPMLRRLTASAKQPYLYDINATLTQQLATETGGYAAQSLTELGSNCDIVILMLPDSEIVNKVVMGTAASQDAIVHSLGAGAVVVDMSSSDPLASRELGAYLANKNISLLDAPVSGGVRKAITGELSIMLGGDDLPAMDKVSTYLETMGKVFRTGGLGSGHASKALNNYVSACGLAAACEALIVGRAFGLQAECLVDVMNASTGRNNSTENKLKPFVLNQQFKQAGFAMQLMHKDINTAATLASDLGLDLPSLEAARALWTKAVKTLETNPDHTEIYRYLDQLKMVPDPEKE